MDMKKMLAEEREEMLRDKYIESEKAGYDLGDRQMVTWSKNNGEAWRFGYNMRNLMDLGDGTKPVYFGIFLDDRSKNLLIDSLIEMIPSGWTVLCHHCTLSFGDPADNREVFEYIARNLGKSASMDAVSVGLSDDAMAVGLSGDFRSKNPTPHVTVAIPPGGKPVNSNRIAEWSDFRLDDKLTGTVDSFPSHFGWRH